MVTFKLTADDWQSVRDRYPEPFGPDDQIRGQHHQTADHPSTSGGNNRRARDPNPPEPSGSHPSRNSNLSGQQPRGDYPRNNRQQRMGGGGDPPSNPPGGGGGGGPPSDGGDPERTDSEDGNPRRHINRSDNRSDSAREQGPSNFGQTRYTSADTTFSEKEIFTYNPTPLTQVEILRAAFQRFEDLIVFQLLGTSSDNLTASNLRKTLLQSIPKPEFYYGNNNDYVAFDEWVRSLVRWLALAGLCGPERRWSESRGDWILTSIDIQRTNIIGTLVKGDAAIWFNDYVEAIPLNFDRNNPTQGRMSFMEVVSGIYRRFIHDASLTHVAEKLKDVRYTASGGIKGVFSAMVRYAKCMPSPPDVYSFKQQLMLKLPETMADDMTGIHGVTAEASSVNDLMQAALACERSFVAKKYYQKLKEENKRAKRRRSRSRSKERKRNGKKKERERSPSPSRLQKVDGHRYKVKPNTPWDSKIRSNQYNKEPNQYNGRRNIDRFNKPTDKRPEQSSVPGRLYRMIDTKGSGKARLFQMVEVSDAEEEGSGTGSDNVLSDNEMLAAMNSGSEPEQSDNESDPWGGSQYSSDASEHFGFMRERFTSMHEVSDDESENVSSESEYKEPSDDQAYDEILCLNFTEYLCTMKIDEKGVEPTLEPERIRVPHYGKRPKRTADDNRCLSAFVEINGLKAFVLFDSGSTADAISPDFAKHAKIRVFQLENPVTLQLGTKGSRSKINHGCISKYTLTTHDRPIQMKGYFDVANVDRYDAVVGTVFMRRHGISLNFEDDSIRIKGKPIPSLSEGEEVRELARRNAKRVSTRFEIPNRGELDVKKRPVKHGLATKSK
ncbi:hypothetical protein L218DRAFT_1006255 [Marasmius fiardii PR-910]|nr:hypothetical protein L218DRAFT_1006255 [Marasmius fiardii PR-910]